MTVIHETRWICALVRTVVALVYLGAVGGGARAETLKLELEDELGRLGPPPAEVLGSNLLPVVLGITNLRYRLDRAMEDVATWEQTNDALAAHLDEREGHLMDLQAFVDRQDGTIEILTRQVEAMGALAEIPVPDVVAAAPASSVPSQPATPASPSSFYGVPLGSPYVEGGMVAVIVILLTWTLYLRGQLRNTDQAVTVAPLSGGGRQAPVMEADNVPSVSSETTMDVPGEELAPDKDMVDLWHDYDRAAAALITSVGAGAVPEEHRARLKSVLAGVSKKEEFLAEASALADSSNLDGDTAAKPADRDPDPARQTVIMHAMETAESERLDQADPTEIPEADGGRKTSTDTAMLKEVDTLIAFENYEQASDLLNQLLDEAPANPEYRLRLLHILSAGGQTEASAEQEEILAAMMDGPLSETLHRVRRIGRDLLPGHPLFTGPDEQADVPGEAEFDADPVFDITFSEEDEEEQAPSADFDPLEESGDEVTAAPVAEVESVDDDLDDFMKSAFDAPVSENDESVTEGSDEGFDLTMEPGESPGNEVGDGELSFDMEMSEGAAETEGEGPVSADIDDEFDVLLDELLQEDAEEAVKDEDGLSLEPQPDADPANPDSGDDGDNLFNDMLDLTLDDPQSGSVSTVSYADPEPELDADDEASKPDPEAGDDAGNTIFKIPGKLG